MVVCGVIKLERAEEETDGKPIGPVVVVVGVGVCKVIPGKGVAADVVVVTVEVAGNSAVVEVVEVDRKLKERSQNFKFVKEHYDFI